MKGEIPKKKMMSTEIISLIKEGGLENEILNYLIQDRLKYLKCLESEYANANAIIRCVRAINGRRNEAIDALCEPETPKEKAQRRKSILSM